MTGDFLQDLRSNRPQRPMGTRPLPWLRAAASKTDLTTQTRKSSIGPPRVEVNELPPRSMSALSTRQDSLERPVRQPTLQSDPALERQAQNEDAIGQSSGEQKQGKEEAHANIPYIENGQRWMERQESRSITMAMRDMDLKEEQKLRMAAQDEASELVWKHRNPNAPYRNPDAAKYKAHLRKGSHARAHSVERLRSMEQNEQLGNQASIPDLGATSSGQSSGQNSRVPSDSSMQIPLTDDEGAKKDSPSKQETTVKIGSLSEKPYRGLAESVARDITTHRRTSSGSKRKASGQAAKSVFKNPDDQIYEESEEVQNAKNADPRPPPVPLSMRRNPFARVKFAQQERHERSNSEPILETKKFNKYEIHKNPPSQSRNPGYTLNTPTPPRPATPNDNALVIDADNPGMKDGKEIRGDDIRAATSMKKKDKSPKLPTPSVVSDKPGRPIVSFDPNWKPKEIELKEEISKVTPRSSIDFENDKKSERASLIPRKAATTTSVPTLDVFDIATRERAHSPPPAIHNDTMETSIVVPTINVDGPPQVPSIREAEPPMEPAFSHSQAPLGRSNTTPIPIINFPDEPNSFRKQSIPTINVSDDPVPRSSQPPIPTINFPDQPTLSSKQRPLPAIKTPEKSRIPNSTRPLPTINAPVNLKSSGASRPLPTISAPPSHHPSQPQHAPSTRPLPQPTPSPPRPNPLRHAFTTSALQSAEPSSAPHWSPALRRDQAQCARCALPIAGRIVSAAKQRFHPACFTCHHCGEGLECVAFYPEPDAARAARLERIQQRLHGEPAVGDTDDVDDDDTALRFYCHLDFHEFFSPRCKSCKTPIEGEVVVACGAEWHVGHFFCAQCGDPFDSATPFVERDGYAWCVGCHTNRYSAKCRRCRRPVTEVVVTAVGAEWHQECFVCMECGGAFDDGRYFLRGESQDPVCVRCEERRLKA
ncbi:MAG: hypothetical protein M1822_007943 [Bathelium mastoideum]|nr:MAG: hypothetical protein M1822_007943 [Bathelium mastoideum]